MKKRAAIFLIAITTLGEGIASGQQVGDTFDQFFRYVEVKNKVIESHLPGETVDHFSGNLRIVQEDMAFPGQGGLDLRIMRVYSSKIWGRSDLFSPEPFLAGKELTDVGLGWSMHMGRVRAPNAFGQPPAGTVPVFEAQDGSSHAFYQITGSSTDYISRDSWKFTRNWQACSGATSGAGACITTTSGLRYEFAESNKYEIDGPTPVWPLSSIVDVFGNRIRVQYESGSSLGGSNGRIRNITDTYGRTLTFNYGTCGASPSAPCLETIEARGPGGVLLRRMIYTHEVRNAGIVMGIGQKNVAFLTGAVLDTGDPAENVGYTYDYNFNPDVTKNALALRSITYPYGGKTEYTYNTVSFFTGCDTIPMPAVQTRTTSGRLLPTGATWTYTYESPNAVDKPEVTDPDSTQNSDFQTTTILRPDGKTDRYKFYGFAYLKRLNVTGHTWKVGLQSQVTRGSDAEAETFNWQKGAVIIQGIPNQQLYRAPSYGTTCPNWAFDNTIQAPVLKSHTLQRPGTGAPSQRATYKYEVVTPTNPSSQADPDGDGFDNFGQPFKVTETGERQRTIEYEYDYDNALYQMVGRVKLEKICEGSVCYESKRTFGGLGNRMNSQTLKGVKTEFDYWQGSPHANGNLKTVTNALGHKLKLNYVDGFGLPTDIDFNGFFKITRQANTDGSLKSETRRGHTTSYTYDLAGRLRTIELPSGRNPNNDPTTYCYKVVAGVEESYSITRGGPIRQCPTNPQTGQYRETMTLDGLGRVTRTDNSLGESQSRSFDRFGRLIFNSYPFGSGIPEIGDKFEYDALDRPTITSRRFLATGSCSDAASCKQQIFYNDKTHCRTITIDRAKSDQTITTNCFESFGNVNDERLVRVRDAHSKQWTYSYDVAGNLTNFEALQPGGTRRFTYHPTTFFLKTDESGPRGTIQLPVSAYNAIGQPKERTDARSIKMTLEYGDPLSRLTKTSYSSGAGEEDVTRAYNGEDLETVSSKSGGAYTYEYDELARLSDQSWTFQNNTYLTKYRFDHAGCLKQLFYPTGTIATMTCDAKGRPRSIMLSGTTTGTIVTNATYHPGGQPRLIEFGNGVNVSRTIENGRIKSISTSGATAPVPGFTYEYDGANNITAITDSTGVNTFQKITYDKLDRVQNIYRKSTSSPAFAYFYDELGNRTQVNGNGNVTTKYVYDGKTNLLLQSTGPSAPPPGALTWNAAGQLATNLDGTKYQYDGLGRRVLKSPPGGAGIVYHYDVAGRLLAETSATTGATLREYFYLANQLVAVAGCISGNAPPCSEREWYHTDILGDVVARTNSSKAITVGLVYQAWGELPTAGMGIRGTRLYNGRTFDEFSAGGGFYDYGARIYSPELGRFLSADPAWSQQNDPQSSNLYAYTLNNPYKYTDPTGREPFALTQNWNLSGKPQRVVDAWEFIVNQRQVQSYWQQVLDEQMTVKEAKENMISTGNAYEGITDAGRTRSLLEQDVVTRVEKFEIFEEGTQLVRLGIAIARDIFGGGDSHIQKAIAQNEIERSNHAIRLAKLLIGLPPAGQICSACHDGDRIYDTPMYVPDK
jgi:RHS repeat-associated protein